MTGSERRAKIASLLDSKTPVNGTELARRLGVSRQIIVQDIALMRAENKNILSTNKGYLLYDSAELSGQYRRVFHVRHTTEQVRDELLTITELGGTVLDVLVEHELYGQIRVDLLIASPSDAMEFADRLRTSTGAPLKMLTQDDHYHTVTASSERLLDLIQTELVNKGYLVTDSE